MAPQSSRDLALNDLKVIQWNVNGWLGEHTQTKRDIIEHFDADIISICETHLESDTKIKIDDYVCYDHNRQMRNARLRRTFGGVQVLIHNRILSLYDVNIIDKSRDGILCLKLSCKMSDFSCMLISCYLPPQNSVWGRDADGFYSHILNLLYTYNDVDIVLIMGDLNSRIGQEIDIINHLGHN